MTSSHCNVAKMSALKFESLQQQLTNDIGSVNTAQCCQRHCLPPKRLFRIMYITQFKSFRVV
jgi:hypothetical protein